jgi:hypothetical protein
MIGEYAQDIIRGCLADADACFAWAVGMAAGSLMQTAGIVMIAAGCSVGPEVCAVTAPVGVAMIVLSIEIRRELTKELIARGRR